MTSCRDVSELLSEAALGELPSERATEVEAHLRGCGSCAAVAGELRETLGLVRSARSQAPALPGLAPATLEAPRNGAGGIVAVLLVTGALVATGVLLSKTTVEQPAPKAKATKVEPDRAREPDVQAKAPPTLAPLPGDELARIERASTLVARNAPRSSADLATRDDETWPVDPGSYSTSYGGTLDGLSGSSVERAIAWLPASH